ncbi:MAG: hypothetical protein M1492_01750 [Gammaproteobacteria bacterium]|nr:hypothetical protein [Gammaproteobacteria bacterium]
MRPDYPRRAMTPDRMESWTYQSKSRMDSIIKLARNLETDPEREQRAQKCLCRMCYYGSRLGGAAIKSESCMCCGVVQTYGSTNTDALCLPCAQEMGLCKHCGGDRELRVKRRKWPSPKVPFDRRQEQRVHYAQEAWKEEGE